MNKNEVKKGAVYAAFSYLLWGLLPIYWKLIDDVGTYEILANRIFWSFIFIMFVLLITKKWNAFQAACKQLFHYKRQSISLVLASLLISCNWFVYIWAVNNNRMIEASLGYYINPLVSVLLGIIVLREKLSTAQIVSFLVAFIGVFILAGSYGKIPWISLTLAFSFGLYGLAKKMIKVDSAIGLALETLAAAPFAMIYMGYLFWQETNTFMNGSVGTDLLLMGAGAATAVPLLYFAKGAQKIPLSMLGYIQYIAPTITLILGIFVYHEHFTDLHLLSFLFIWAALAIYSISQTKFMMKIEKKWKKKIGA